MIGPEAQPASGSVADSGHLPLAAKAAKWRSIRLPREVATDVFS
jgi:hypothetical protein